MRLIIEGYFAGWSKRMMFLNEIRDVVVEELTFKLGGRVDQRIPHHCVNIDLKNFFIGQ